MMGLVLWFNPEPGVGVVWCEDQGPLAFLGAEVDVPGGAAALACGDQLHFTFETRDGVRYVREIRQVTRGAGKAAPAEILAEYHRQQEDEPVLRVVA